MKKYFSLICTSLFFVISLFFLATCKKEYSYEGGLVVAGGTSGSARFTLLGAGGTCTGSIVSGKYYIDTALTVANAVQLKVHVDSIGNYNITTSSINGFQFSGAGNFTDTGIQTITLKGIGTPVAEGTFTFNTPVGAGCSFTVVVIKAPVAVASYILVGTPNLCPGVTIVGNYVSGYKLTAGNTATIVVNVLAVGPYSISTDLVDGFSFSATGTFTKVGLQTVQLNGSGTPEKPDYVIFTPTGDTSSCRFTVPVINPEPLATYVLESVYGNPPNPCVYTVAGTYASGIALSATNTVSIRVYVTVVGNFTIATNMVNGISFSYTGTFTNIGTQQVVLFGNGKPTAAGTFGFIPQIVGPSPLGGASCGFNVTVQ